MRQIVLDTETTGLSTRDGNRIIEVGCVELMNRKKTGNTYHVYINPERESEAGALAVHGLDSEFLKDKPVFSEVVQDLMDFLQGAELIIHNAPFDVGFLNYELSLLGADWQKIEQYCSILDSLKLAKKTHPGQANSLDALCKRYHVDNSSRTMHGALLDSELLADVYLRLTGGQVILNLNASESQTALAHKPIEIRKHKVISPSTVESQRHNELLALMHEKNEKILWDQYTK